MKRERDRQKSSEKELKSNNRLDKITELNETKSNNDETQCKYFGNFFGKYLP
jgi:hypothetical protein